MGAPPTTAATVGPGWGVLFAFGILAAYVVLLAHPRWRKAIRWLGGDPVSAFGHIAFILAFGAVGGLCLVQWLGYDPGGIAPAPVFIGAFALMFVAGAHDVWRAGGWRAVVVPAFAALCIAILAVIYYTAVGPP